MVVADTTMIAGEGRCPLDAQIDINQIGYTWNIRNPFI